MSGSSGFSSSTTTTTLSNARDERRRQGVEGVGNQLLELLRGDGLHVAPPAQSR